METTYSVIGDIFNITVLTSLIVLVIITVLTTFLTVLLYKVEPGVKEHTEDTRLPSSTSRRENPPSSDVELGESSLNDHDDSVPSDSNDSLNDHDDSDPSGVKEHTEDTRLPSSTSRRENPPSSDVELGESSLNDHDDSVPSESVFNSDRSKRGTYNNDSTFSMQSLDFPTFEKISKDARIQKDFVVISKLGEGGFGTVFKCRNKDDDKLYAIKIIPHQSRDQESISKEAEIIHQFNHQNVVRYHNDWILEKEDSEVDEDDEIQFEQQDDGTRDQYLLIQMEFCPQTLRERIDNEDLSKGTKIKFFNEILEGLKYIHDTGVIHRDLNPKNIFLINETIKIGDFGSARYAVQNSDGSGQNINGSEEMTDYIGTFPYCAPELKNKRYDKRVDLYSLGFISFELIYSFPQNCTEHQKKPVIDGLREKMIQIPEEVTGSARHIIQKLLHHHPDKRMTLLDVKQYLEKGVDFNPTSSAKDTITTNNYTASLGNRKTKEGKEDTCFHFSLNDSDVQDVYDVGRNFNLYQGMQGEDSCLLVIKNIAHVIFS